MTTPSHMQHPENAIPEEVIDTCGCMVCEILRELRKGNTKSSSHNRRAPNTVTKRQADEGEITEAFVDEEHTTTEWRVRLTDQRRVYISRINR